MTAPGAGPHQEQPVLRAGAALAEARAAAILVHGRGANAESILSLAAVLDRPEIAYLAPQAAGHSWYPYSFLAPVETNEPGLTSALEVISGLLRGLDASGFPPERVVLLGFSQGACLTLEFAARAPRRYGAVIGLSGGLIGPPGGLRAYRGSLASTPVFIGCSDGDPHIPLARVHETAALFRSLGGEVTERIYPGMDHTVNDDEVRHVRRLLAGLVEGDGPTGPAAWSPIRTESS